MDGRLTLLPARGWKPTGLVCAHLQHSIQRRWPTKSVVGNGFLLGAYGCNIWRLPFHHRRILIDSVRLKCVKHVGVPRSCASYSETHLCKTHANVRHGFCPNLLDAANRPHHNARDVTLCF